MHTIVDFLGGGVDVRRLGASRSTDPASAATVPHEQPTLHIVESRQDEAQGSHPRATRRSG